MNIHVVGGGFVGTVSAVVLAEAGHDVQLLEQDPERRRGLRQGRPTFTEPGLPEALAAQLDAGRLVVPDGAEPGPSADVTIICVGTPRRPDGSAELDQVVRAARDAARRMRGGVIAVKSTVPPGTLDDIVTPAVAAIDPSIATASLPEFLAEGDALSGARHPDRVVIGCTDLFVTECLRRLHAIEPIVTAPRTAEAIKYCSNAMLAARVGMVNELSGLCEDIGADVDEVMHAVGQDPRIGPGFLKAGLGFGGSCFPKDVAALCHLARRRSRPLRLLETVLENNEQQPVRAVDLLEEELGPLRDRDVALLGLSFKPGTSDLRESRAVAVHGELRRRGARVTVHDPVASEGFAQAFPEASVAATPAEALEDADGCIIATAWPQYRALDWTALTASMRRPVIVDGWRLLDAQALGEDVQYRAIGRGAPLRRAEVVA